MPQTLSPQIVLQKPADLPRLCWSADKYESLFVMDLLTHGKYELIAGDIVEKMALRYTHAQIITLLFAFFSRFCSFPLLGSAFTLAASDTSMPEPDFAVFATETPTLTERGYVRPGDVRLVVEVSDATLPRDTTEKVTLYAHAGIAEYWVIDVAGRRLRSHTDLTDGAYMSITEYDETESVAPRFAPASSVLVAALLP